MTGTVRDRLFGGRFLQGLFHLRYELLDALHYRKRSPDQASTVVALRALDQPLVAFTIAFNVPEAVALLSDTMACFAPDMPLVVCDNSTDPAACARLRAICAEAGRLYCQVPRAPLVKFQSSRSHATALNWVLRNLIVPSGIHRFATLDHDLVLLGPDDLAGRLDRQPCYGYVRRQDRSRAWYLWPGFSLFDLNHIAPSVINFGTDRMLGLDTGGRMWNSVYRHMNPDTFVPATVREGQVPEADPNRLHQVFDAWFHVGQVSYRNGNLDVIAALRRRLERDPASLAEIIRG